jgi:hypothetical protein
MGVPRDGVRLGRLRMVQRVRLRFRFFDPRVALGGTTVVGLFRGLRAGSRKKLHTLAITFEPSAANQGSVNSTN